MTLEQDKRDFETNGFIGPFKLWEPEEMTQWWREQRRILLDPESRKNAVFDNPVNYDRHLDIDGLSRLIFEEEIVRRFQALIGDDLLCWRTEFFPKNPGDPGTGWHQVERYAIGEAQRGMLEPTLKSETAPMELTAWVAFTPAKRENGCMRLLPGSHREWRYDEMRPIRWDGSRPENTFFGYDYDELKLDPNWSPPDDEVAHMEMEPGEFIIFTARCIHGSNPNTSRRQRMGFAIRVVPTHVKVYDAMTSFNEFGHDFDLGRHGCVLLAGEDRYGHNRFAAANASGLSFTPLGPAPAPVAAQ